MIKGIILIGMLVGVIGCSKAPALKVYSLNVPDTLSTKSSSYKSKSLKVTYPQSIREQMSHKMNFSYSIDDRGTYQNSEWSNDMSKLLQGTFIEVIDSAKLFKVVLSNTTTLKENYRLESNVFAFEHRVRGDISNAIVSVQFTLINGDTGKLMKSKRFSYSENTQTTNAKGYAQATNIAMAKLSRDLLTWLR